jgi:transketolase
LALYVILAEKGFFPSYELTRFCQDEGILGGHPEYGKIPGVEASTGSLGHGLSIAVGMALGARQAKASHRVFAVISDGECNEGSTWEAALCASKHRLANLTAVLDYNQQQSYATTHEVLELEPLAAKWSAFGWGVREVDGHDVEQLKGALRQVPFHPEKPSLLICHTIKGKGVSFVENDLQWHHKSKISDAEVGALLAELEG